MAEGVHVVAHLRAHPEAVAEVAPAVEYLAREAHLRRQVHVGLEVLAARDVPPAVLNQNLHSREELGVYALHLLVEPGFAAGVDELGVLVAALGGGAEGGQRLVHAGLPAPQPHWVDVRVPYHVDDQGSPLGIEERCEEGSLSNLTLDGSRGKGADDEALQDHEGRDRRQHGEYASRGEYVRRV
jgi:hypothetical protein